METIYEVVRVIQKVKKTKKELLLITNPNSAVELINKYILEEDREVLLVLVLNTKNAVVAVHRCHMGTLDSSIASARDIYKTAILNNAASIIIAHNHPSGFVRPSEADIALTERIVQAGQVLGINLLDHIIVGWKEGFYSFKQHGMM